MKHPVIRLSSPAPAGVCASCMPHATRPSSFVLRTCAALALAAFAANATPRIPYANDFATRTSGATPSDRWMESPYIPGALARSVSSISAHGREPYNYDTAYQDGWTMKTGYCRSSVLFTVADDGGNPGALVNANSSSYQNSATVAMQPFYNEFTDGVLKISVDIRTPAQTDSFNPANNAYALCAPVYKSTLDLAVSTFSAPMYFGPASLYDNRGSKEGQEGKPIGWFLRAVLRGRNAANESASYYGQYDSRNDITAGSWVRYEAVLDLDAGRYTATYADLGTAHPTPDSAGGSPAAFHRWESDNTQFSFYFVNPITAKTGGIAGLAFYVQGIKQAANTADAPMFDNIAVSWKAPGASDFAPVYENNFTTRRYRQVEPVGATTGAYALVPTTNTVQSSFYERGASTTVYSLNENGCRRLVPDGAPYAGQDGWRRIAGTAPFTMVNPNNSGGYGWDNATVLRATGSGKAGFVATPIGTTVTSGKVRLYFDIMMGVITNTSTSSSREIIAACFLAGNGAHSKTYTSSTSIANAVQGYALCGGGTRYALAAKASAISTRINHYSGGSGLANTQGPKSATDETLENKFIYAGRWGRYVITLDLGTRTYDYTVYQLSTTGRAMDYDHSSSSVIVSNTGRSLASNAPASIDSVVLFSTGQADWNGGSEVTSSSKRVGRFPLFDNVRVCLVNGDGTDGTELYSCNFEYGYRMSVQNAASLVGHSNREGADRWIRRGNAYGLFNVIDAGGGDSVLALDDFGWIEQVTRAGYAVQPFGSVTKNCASVDFAADIRPPECFARDSSCFVRVEVGGDGYAQGVYRPASGNTWRYEPRIGFGFVTGGGKNAVGHYTNILISVQSRTSSATATTNSAVAIDRSHWYRFRAKAEPPAGRFSVKVYDQGATKPAANAADGTLVETFANLALPSFGGQGMTTFGLAAAGFAGMGGGLDDPNVALVDNLKVDFAPAAMMIIVR